MPDVLISGQVNWLLAFQAHHHHEGTKTLICSW